MYLSQLNLLNWRIYSKVNFEFIRPTAGKPIVLIGAKNGHGKTSLLMALYIGLFGKYGVKYCEGFRHMIDKEHKTISQALKDYRRNNAPCNEPTQIELVFKSVRMGSNKEIRITRRWHFDQNNNPKPGDSFEEVEIQHASDTDTEPQLLQFQKEEELQQIESLLFPCHLTPAFFFDGEQAAELIGDMGGEGMLHATEVMYGADVIREATDYLHNYSLQKNKQIGGKKISEKLQKEKKSIDLEIKTLNAELGELEKQRNTIRTQILDQQNEREEIHIKINRLGGKGIQISKIQKEFEILEKEEKITLNKLRECLCDAGLFLATAPFKNSLLKQVDKEKRREQWENLKKATKDKAKRVLAIALPHPQSDDNLLCNLDKKSYEQLKTRFTNALIAIYDPPDPKMANQYILEHVQGNTRERLKDEVQTVFNLNSSKIRYLAEKYRTVTQNKDICKDRLKNEEKRPTEISQLVQCLTELNEDISNSENLYGNIDQKVNDKTNSLTSRNNRSKDILKQLTEIEPTLNRFWVADKTRLILKQFNDKLSLICGQRLQKEVMHYFERIADKRFKNMNIQLRGTNHSPTIETIDGNSLQLSTSSGFERRSFSIAFCLALADITHQRIPLVIDTPVGNADAEYRKRALRVLSEFSSTDQIIILTHDEEVRLPFLEAIEDKVLQKILVQFDFDSKESTVFYNQFFDFSR